MEEVAREKIRVGMSWKQEAHNSTRMNVQALEMPE